MTSAKLEHANITVSDADKTARTLCDLFGWHVRWEGDVLGGAGRTVHVGDDDTYLAIYTPKGGTAPTVDSYNHHGGLNHVGVVVDDLEAVERKVAEAGYKPHMHADYEPGRRFYFDGDDGIEFEVVSYK